MQLLYPANPLRSREPDELYQEEYAAAVESGFRISVFSFEEFTAGAFRARPAISGGDTDLLLGIIDKAGNIKLFKAGENNIFDHADLARRGLATPGEILGFSAGLDAEGRVVVYNISELNTHFGLGGALPAQLLSTIQSALGGP